VQANVATAEPKAADGIVQMMRALRVARRSALKARTQAANPTAGVAIHGSRGDQDGAMRALDQPAGEYRCALSPR
jgi:transposase